MAATEQWSRGQALRPCRGDEHGVWNPPMPSVLVYVACIGLPLLGGLFARTWRFAVLVALVFWAALAILVPWADAVVFPFGVAVGHLVRAGWEALAEAYRPDEDGNEV